MIMLIPLQIHLICWKSVIRIMKKPLIIPFCKLYLREVIVNIKISFVGKAKEMKIIKVINYLIKMKQIVRPMIPFKLKLNY